MAVKNKYQAKDGTQFDTRQEAQDWDDENFTIWLETSPQIDALHFYQVMDPSRDSWSDASSKQIAKQLLRAYWDNHVL